MANVSYDLDDRDPVMREFRKAVLDLATAYTGGRATYQEEFSRVLNEMVAAARTPSESAMVLARSLHTGMLFTFAALSTMAAEWDIDFSDAVLVLERSIEELIDRERDA